MAVPRDNSKFLRNLPLVRFNEEPRGYSKSEVDRVLQNIAPIADSIEELQSKLRACEERAVQAEGRAASAEARLGEAEAETARLTAVAEAKPAEVAPVAAAVKPEPTEPTVDQAFDETLRKTLLLAQRTADATVSDAEAEAASMLAAAEAEASTVLGSAKDEADTLLSTTRAEHNALAESIEDERTQRLDELNAEIVDKRAELQESLQNNEAAERDRLMQEVRDLTQMRDLLMSDVDLFEEHLNTRREVLRAALGSLNNLADNAADLTSVDAPEPSASAVFDPDDYEPVALDLPDGVDHAESGGAANDADDGSSEGFLFGEPPSDSGDATEMFEVVITDSNDSGEPDAFSAFAGVDVEQPDIVDLDDDYDESAFGSTSNSDEGSVRPAWADAVPPEPAGASKQQPVSASDPFLDQLRRATEGDEVIDESTDADADAEAQALSRFLDNDEQASNKTGWFGRRK